MRATVAVVTAPGHPTLLESNYAIRHVVEYWRPRGVDFVLTADPRRAPAGDIAWQHLDVTRVGRDYRALLAKYPLVINGGALDTSKRRTASHLVTRDDLWQGPVMLKTDLNFGGHADDWGARWRIGRHPAFHRLRDRLPPRLTGHMRPEEYRVYSSKALVPGWAWRDRRFVIQRMLAERKGDLFGIRRWFFFGDREYAYRSFARGPIVQGDVAPDWEPLGGVPDELRQVRERLGLDYAKIDYAEVDGEVVVYDINPAVSADGPRGFPIQAEMVPALVPGLEYFLAKAGL